MTEMLRRIKGAPISLVNLTKRYEDVVAVDNMNLEIEAGEFLTLLGPSGSGKTTTLMMIAGFVLPTSGDVLVDGRSIVALPPFKRNLGVVFQQYSLFPHMSVFDNIAFPLQMRGMSRAEIERRVKAALEMVRLPGLEHRKPHQLSGGQQQRVALARALVFEPPVLLLDEPMGALDLKLRQELQIELKHLHDELGVTIVAVTHDQGEALTMSDRIVVMNDGKIQQVGAPQELYRRPANAFVANFLGETNLLTGRLVSQEDSRGVVELDDGLQVQAIIRTKPDESGRVTLSIRPESIQPVGEASLPNTFEGAVEEVIYLGEITKYRFRLGNSTTVIADWQNRGGVPLLKQGERARVGWELEDCISV